MEAVTVETPSRLAVLRATVKLQEIAKDILLHVTQGEGDGLSAEKPWSPGKVWACETGTQRVRRLLHTPGHRGPSPDPGKVEENQAGKVVC